MKMGTPLKNLSTFLSPKVLSPLSPKLFGFTNKDEQLRNASSSRSRSATKVARELDYAQTSLKNNSKHQPVSIFVTDASTKSISRNDILLNSPIKRIILKNGLEDRGYFNVLGEGHFGKVVRGFYNGETVAIKVVKNAKSYCRELNALGLNHSNVVKTLDITANKNENYNVIVMEYFQNALQLHSIIQNKAYDLDNQLVKLSLGICEGLRYCHMNGILHLDLKPQNILVCEGVCKICDFGNSIKKFEANSFINQGTAFYTAPELLIGNPPSEKCDIYSLGIVLWQMKHRSIPYSNFDNTETVMYQVVKCNLRPETNSPKCKFSQLYQDCWNEDSSIRPELSDLLEKLLQL